MAAHAAVLGSVGACNQILGNESTEAITRDGGLEAPDAPVVGVPDAAVSQDAGPTVCGLDSKRCSGECVSRSSTEFGCGSDSCAACDLPFANVLGCDGQGRCGFAGCKGAHEDCDGDPTNGCEIDLTQKESCGECGSACGPGEQCVMDSEGFIGCDAITCLQSELRCDAFCTDTAEDPLHCGGCNMPCQEPQIDVATAICTAGRCGTLCDGEGEVFCQGLCFPQSDTRCGPYCDNCASYTGKPHVAATTGMCLEAGRCDVVCVVGYEDANLAADDGCEQGPPDP